MEVGHINNVTVERTPTDKYFVVLNVDFEPKFKLNNGGTIGIDVGIKEFYFDSNGKVVNNPKYLEESMCKLAREQRKLSRKQKGSNNRNKQRIKVARLHEKITNQRNDFLQKESTMLVSRKPNHLHRRLKYQRNDAESQACKIYSKRIMVSVFQDA